MPDRGSFLSAKYQQFLSVPVWAAGLRGRITGGWPRLWDAAIPIAIALTALVFAIVILTLWPEPGCPARFEVGQALFLAGCQQ